MHLDYRPSSCHQLGQMYGIDGKQLQQQYKHRISDYKDLDQREHAAEWMLFEQNMGTHLSIGETALSNDELYTVVTNKSAKGRKGAVVAMIMGTQADRGVAAGLQRLTTTSGLGFVPPLEYI